ncbi:MAG: phosphotransferase family protein [Candidatus Sumerlaeota bacterium]
MTFVPGDTLSDLARAGRLDNSAVAGELGRLLRRLHGIRLDGFGFIDTDQLRRDGQLIGLHQRYEDFFRCRLDTHLDYVTHHGLLAPGIAAEAYALVTELLPRHVPRQACLVHRDPAWWNLIGTTTRIAALVDWDDAVAGDPADDLAMLRCFHDADYCTAVETAYWDGQTPDADFPVRIALHWFRNMLWKAMLRHQLGYFRPGAAAFLNALCADCSLEARTRELLDQSINALRRTA